MTPSFDKLDIALSFINSSAAPLFLTGKAGTGKTTFLKSLTHKTHKKFIVVAPTGIAALNAGGVTIHSQFLLPLGSYIPTDNIGEKNLTGKFYTPRSLTVQHPLSAPRRKVLREIDLMVIDEVSMLRADVLDAIDYRLRRVRGLPQKAFGGVQMLFIGDVYQLPPIMRDEEWAVLSAHYRSPWFFEAQVLKNAGLVRLELEKVYRQEDRQFVDLLNRFRYNKVEPRDVEALNARYLPPAQRQSIADIITLVTHNYQADRINTQKMKEIDATPSILTSNINGDFPENMYPLPEPLELKPGAQVMFVRNDSRSGRFYNGMLAKVISIDAELGVRVEPVGTNQAFYVERETWENKKYEIAASTGEMREDVLGVYAQYPLKPAWAITVHKSQGLTFERAVLDVGNAFASGQVYVALSRLRSLEGLVLATRISDRVIPAEESVVAFSEETEKQAPMEELLQVYRRQYLHELLPDAFDFEDILFLISRIKRRNEGIQQFEHVHLREFLNDLEQVILGQKPVSEKFKQQIIQLLSAGKFDFLAERLERGAAYYSEILWGWMEEVQLHLMDVMRYSGTKKYREEVEELDKALLQQVIQLDRLLPLFRFLNGQGEHSEVDAKAAPRAQKREQLLRKTAERLRELPAPSGRKSGKVKKKSKKTLSELLAELDTDADIEAAIPKKPKPEKGASHRLSCTLIAEGKTVGEVARDRQMAVSTIEGHIIKGLKEGVISTDKVISDLERQTLSKLLLGIENIELGAQYAALNGNVSYTKLRLMQIIRELENGKN
jgi:hypothetical protein